MRDAHRDVRDSRNASRAPGGPPTDRSRASRPISRRFGDSFGPSEVIVVAVLSGLSFVGVFQGLTWMQRAYDARQAHPRMAEGAAPHGSGPSPSDLAQPPRETPTAVQPSRKPTDQRPTRESKRPPAPPTQAAGPSLSDQLNRAEQAARSPPPEQSAPRPVFTPSAAPPAEVAPPARPVEAPPPVIAALPPSPEPAPAAPADPPAPAAPVVSFARPIGAPPRPVYPQRAAERGREGAVKISLIISPNGTVKSASIVSETPPSMGFGQAALAAVLRTRFEPKQVNGVPTESEFAYVVRFRTQ
jgi:TonB family protein